jgi:hypothetical protein
MAASRYWRAINFEAYGNDGLDISELQLFYNGTRVDVGATITASIAPVSGALSALQDGSAAASVTWDAATVKSPGFAIYFDLGAGVTADVDAVRAGGGSAQAKMVASLTMQASSDAISYDGSVVVGRFPWPGVNALNPPPSQTLQVLGTETFATGIPAGFGSVLVDAATLSPVWDSASQAVDLDSSGFNAAWMFSLYPAVNGLRLEFDIEILTANSGNNPMIGAVFKGGPQLLQQLFQHAASPQAISSARSPGPESLGISAIDFNTTALGAALPTSGLHTYIFTSAPSSSGTRDYTMSVDGSGVAFAHGQTGTAAMLTGGVFVRSCKVRLHAVRVYQIVSGGSMLPMPKPVRSLGLDIVPPLQPVDAFRVRSTYADIDRKDMEWGGKGRVRGFTLDYVNPVNKPYQAFVRLVREIDGQVVRAAWSGVDGGYDFQRIDETQSYSVVAYYLAHGKQAVIADGLTRANGKVELMA